ncbi:MAG: aldehyde dehydrogenase family protein [Thermoplasmatales archaeon]
MIVRNKYTGEIIAEFKDTTLKDAEEILNRSKKAFKEMLKLPAYERYEALMKVAKEVKDQKKRFAKIITEEMGKPIKYSVKEVDRASFILQCSAEESKRLYGETIPMDVEPRGKGVIAFYNRVPIGPVYSITPFNDPLVVLAHKVGPAIASGNTIISKPASLTPYAASVLNKLVEESGLPDGTMQTIFAPGGGEISNFFLASDDIKMITFTGGTEAADRLIKNAGVKKYTMELGNNSPVIVWDDADIEEAAVRITDAAMESQGQNCLHAQRIIVNNKVYNEFKEELIEKVASLKVGDPMDPTTDFGPMISEGEAKRVENCVKEAVKKGAKVIIGGVRDRNIYMPTLLENVNPTSEIWKKEIFGPVTALMSVNTFDEAIDLANDVPYGLQAGIFTSNFGLAIRGIRELDFGSVLVNDTSDFRIDVMPFGGMKKSGLGREGIRFAINEMTEIKLVIMRV